MIEELAARVAGQRGKVVIVELDGADATRLVYELDVALDDGATPAPQVCFVLGRHARTRDEAVGQFVAALRLPYEATGCWDDFLCALGDVPASNRSCVVVADAQELLADDPEGRADLLDNVRFGPACMGGGWATVVLANSADRANSAESADSADSATTA